jgi:Flp pilus assembly protein TadD
MVFLLVAACHAASTTTIPAWQQQLQQARTAELARQHQQARASYQAALLLSSSATDPTQATIAVARQFADTLISWREFDDAAQQLQTIVTLDARRTDAWHDLGLVQHQRQQNDLAIAALRKAIELSPSDTRSHIALAALLWSMGNVAGARDEYQLLLGLPLSKSLRGKILWAINQLPVK